MNARNRVWRGLNSRVEQTSLGRRLSASAVSYWEHPWQIDCEFVFLPSTGSGRAAGEWRGTVNPGFVNGRPAYIQMPAEWLREQVASGAAKPKDFGINPLTGQPYFSAWVFNNEAAPPKSIGAGGPGGPVRLTNSPAPYLVLKGWRNPAGTSGVGTSDSGDIVFGKAEGYPKFFESIGVVPAAPGGKTADVAFDPQRTRQIRAVDVVLTQPRPGSTLTITELNPVTDHFTHQLSTTFLNSFYTLQEGRARLDVSSQFVPPAQDDTTDSPFLALPMNAGDPQMDQIQIATVYVVSPPGVEQDAAPDQTWEPFVQHFVFWNLWHATRSVPPATPLPPLQLITGLGLGILDFLANAFLAPINSEMDEANNFLNQSDMSGIFWST